MDFQTCEVSKTIKHDHTNALFYVWPRLSTNSMYVHFYIERHNEENIPLTHDTSVYLDWHKDLFENSFQLIILLIMHVTCSMYDILDKTLKDPRNSIY